MVISDWGAVHDRILPPSNYRAKRPYNLNNTLEYVSHTMVGDIIIMYAARMAIWVTQDEEEQEGMMSAMIKGIPFLSIVASGEGMNSESMMEGIIGLLNGHYIKGLYKIIQVINNKGVRLSFISFIPYNNF